ncbi:MAG: radical SAM protein, partial [Candidatus Bathyarchaeia archaeon]
LRSLNPAGRLHLDTNATVLTPGDVDRLVEAGLTDIGPDLKGLHVETFMRITGIGSRSLAERYLDNAWSVTRYVIDEYYPEPVFVGIGVPYNPRFMSLEELREIGDRIASIDSSIQVCALNYFPVFRRAHMREPSPEEMGEAWRVLKESGLACVIAQTSLGYISK